MFETKGWLPKWLIVLRNWVLEIWVLEFRGELFLIVSHLNKVKNDLQVIKNFWLAIWKVEISKTFKIHGQFICSIFLLLCVKQFNEKDIHSWSDGKALD